MSKNANTLKRCLIVHTFFVDDREADPRSHPLPSFGFRCCRRGRQTGAVTRRASNQLLLPLPLPQHQLSVKWLQAHHINGGIKECTTIDRVYCFQRLELNIDYESERAQPIHVKCANRKRKDT